MAQRMKLRVASAITSALLAVTPCRGFAHEGGDAGGDAHGADHGHCAAHAAEANGAEMHGADMHEMHTAELPPGDAHSAGVHAIEAATATAPAASRIRSSVRSYTTPTVQLVRDDGKPVALADELNDGRPVVMNFIFTTCTTICPMMSAVFSQFERRLGPDADKVHLMSISIDPEQDTPARLVEYARKFHAGPEWQHYTGTLAESIAVQQAFDVYRGSKMSHSAVTLMRAAPGRPWLRIDGFATADDLVRNYRELLASR